MRIVDRAKTGKRLNLLKMYISISVEYIHISIRLMLSCVCYKTISSIYPRQETGLILSKLLHARIFTEIMHF